ncbi:GNAT family N-acetyltransferase [Roseibium algae]|uniref:GNAT family N-acetyltransferase n=1 Tax=Roseibium algae TaxID=3123038 RepID=A0ABU8TMA4_9HYPH
MIYLETERLILRSWQTADQAPLARLNADPEVMRYFPSPLSREESDALMNRAMAKQEADGVCFAPIEEKLTGKFLGFVGLSRPKYNKPLPFDPCIEIGWRLDRSAWGKGYASEAAQAWLQYGFDVLDLEEIVSFTTVTNQPSRRVMERIGMVHNPADDFLHPALEEGHPLEAHVLYRLKRSTWRDTSVR